MTASDSASDEQEHVNYDPFRLPQRDNPYPVWSELRDHEPVVWSAAIGAWVVSRYEDAVQIIGDTKTFVNEGSTRSFFPPPHEVQAVLDEGLPRDEIRSTQDLDPPDHTRIRKFMLAILTPRRITGLAPRAREISDRLLQGMVGRGGGDFVADFAYKLPLTLLTQLLGIPDVDGEQLHTWSTQKMALQWGRLSLEDHIQAARDYVAFQRYLMDLIEKRRASPADDIVSAMIELRQHDERPLSDIEIVGQMMGLIAAGHETTMNFLSLTLWRVSQRPEVWAEICANRSLIENLVEEGLRIESPAGIWRRTSKPVTLRGQEIPAGARLQILLPSANRDESAFDAAGTLDVHRKQDKPHLAFGRGIHFCAGAALTRLEGKAAFESLVENAPSIRVADGFTPTFRANASQRFLESLPVTIGG